MSTKASNLARRVASGQWLTSTAGQSTPDQPSPAVQRWMGILSDSRTDKSTPSSSNSESTSEESPPKK